MVFEQPNPLVSNLTAVPFPFLIGLHRSPTIIVMRWDSSAQSRKQRSGLRSAFRLIVVASILVAPSSTLRSQTTEGTEASPKPKVSSFDQVAALLTERCLECHVGDDPAGDLDLSSAAGFAAGGESGQSVSTAKLEENLLWHRISQDEMPPEQGLPAGEKQLLRDWLERGGEWDERTLDLFDRTTETRAGRDWWALQPLTEPTVPRLPTEIQPDNPIDAFVISRLSEHGLQMSDRADPVTLARRLAFHLHGLSPSPETVSKLKSALVNEDESVLDDLVDLHLDSPHYGERWARHWLDLARFGESQGFERDKARPHAWRYRDWVIRAINDDIPYNKFAWMQVAGDCDPQLGRDGIIATGFLVGGAWDEVGQKQQSAAMRAVVRQDELEDYVSTVGQAFLGMTIHCARCHDHKFDPIRQAEYYAMCSALDGVRHGNRDVTDPALIDIVKQRKKAIRDELDTLFRQKLELDTRIADRVSNDRSSVIQPLAHWDFESGLEDQIGDLDGVLQGGANLDAGGLVLDGKDSHVLTKPLTQNLHEKTLVATLALANLEQRGGAAISVLGPEATFDSIVFGERESKRWMAGSEHFVRTQDVAGTDEVVPAEATVQIAITYAWDGHITIYRNGKPYGHSYRTTPKRFDSSSTRVAFGIRLLPVGGNRMFAGRVKTASLFDRALTAREIESLHQDAEFVARDALKGIVPDPWLTEYDSLTYQIRKLRSVNVEASKELTYAVVAKQPVAATRRLIRGNTTTPAEVVAAGGVASIQGVDASFGLAADASEAERRRRLADWITNDRNPLFARVIVNRIWQHHFGQGIVRTPSDFGFTGGQPSHPMLLDYLAHRLIESGWSVKALQRLIVTSKTWQQASTHDLASSRIDSDNRFLWRVNRSRLDAETLRDSILQACGKLNLKTGGPPYQDFKTFNFNSQFYDVLDREGEEYNRRTIYRMLIRSGRHRLLDAFDCPDPSSKAPKRGQTTTPLQSLSLMNHPFSIRMSKHFADRVRDDAGQDPSGVVRRAVELAWHRQPNRDERTAFEAFVRDHGLESFCRVLINSNEFLYVD